MDFLGRIFWEFLKFFGRIFLENVLGGVFGWNFLWEFFWEILWEEFFVRNFFGGIIWEEFFGSIFLGGILTLLKSAKLFEYGRNWCFCQDFGLMEKENGFSLWEFTTLGNPCFGPVLVLYGQCIFAIPNEIRLFESLCYVHKQAIFGASSHSGEVSFE